MTQSTRATSRRSPRLRFLVILQGLLFVGSLLAPLSAFAAITSVSIGAQAPNPVTAGTDATYTVTVSYSSSKAIRITAVAGLPTGATFSTTCSTGSPASLTLTIHTTGTTPAGSSTITPTVTETTAGSCNGSGSVSDTNSLASATLVVSTADQTISFPALTGVRLDQAAPVPAATASSTLPVTYSASTPGTCSATSAGVITLLHVGTCTIAADQAGNGSYNPAPQVSRSFSIAKGNQTITFGALAAQTLADSPVAVGATASSGLAVSFSSNSLPVCTVLGTSVTLLTTGTCSISADQAGDADWNAAPQVTRTFAVSTADQTIPPSLVTDKTTVPQGGKVLVTGQGYMADDAVYIYLNSTPVLLTTVTTDSSGGFSVTVTIPTTTAVGAHTIEGLGLDPSGEPLSLTAPITVTAAGEQPATDTAPLVTSGGGLDPLPIGLMLLLFLILIGAAVALADPRSARKR